MQVRDKKGHECSGLVRVQCSRRGLPIVPVLGIESGHEFEHAIGDDRGPNRAKIELYGCPVGSLCTELAKLDHDAQGRAAEIFTLFRTWLRGQFEALGQGEASDDLAMHVLGWSQGVAVMASAFRDPDYVEREVANIERWLQKNIRRRSHA